MRTQTANTRSHAFTLVEMLVVVGIIGILAGLLAPALAGAKQKANRIKCLNHMRQLGLSLTMYASDWEGQFPPRRMQTNAWIQRLQPYYKDLQILKCPSDRFLEDRSYIINGWNDYFESTLSDKDYRKYQAWLWPVGMKEADIPLPSETITFGEKRSGSRHVHMDFSQGSKGNDVEEIEQARHKSGGGKTAGGSNFSFVDGSVRLLKYGESITPINLWAVIDVWRHAPPVKVN